MNVSKRMIEYSTQAPFMNANSSNVEVIDDKQFHQLGAQLLHSIEVALEAADDELDLDLDVERQGGLSHRGTRRENHEIARLKPAGHLVEPCAQLRGLVLGVLQLAA